MEAKKSFNHTIIMGPSEGTFSSEAPSVRNSRDLVVVVQRIPGNGNRSNGNFPGIRKTLLALTALNLRF